MNRHEQRSEETRSRLLMAAEACFAQTGYDATAVAEICQHAGVTKGAFYHHFSSKQEVFLNLLNRWLAGLDAQLATLRDDASSVPDALAAMAGLVPEVLRAADGHLPIYLEFWSKAARDPLVWQATIEPYRRYHDFFAGMIEAGASEGTLRPAHPETVARVIVALAVGLLLQALLDPERTDWELVWQEGVKVLLNGLAKR